MFISLLKGIKDIIYPRVCIACNTKISEDASIEKLICLKCWEKIGRNKPPFCQQCGRQLQRKNINKSICDGCVRSNVYFDRAFSPYRYEGAIKKLIHNFKYNNKKFLNKPLANLLINFINEYEIPIRFIDFLVPIPLNNARLREREFNQSQLLAERLSMILSKPVLNNALSRVVNTRSQAELNGQERFINIKNAFRTIETSAIKGKNILLVDDVFTTGATLSEAACVLKKSGANIVFALTLAN
ncbi:MAG: ComF family protein [Candidatus Omnitrophota bacterium]|jgi:ComF family protein|nr:MAG: ComF family protein [Candidatus Omnitrophota bacterium]